MTDEPTFGRLLPAPATLALIAQLQTARRLRDTRNLYFVEGVRNFVAAVDHRIPIDAVIYSERLLTVPIARKLVRQLKRAGVPYTPPLARTVSQHLAHGTCLRCGGYP
ncbi:MAG: hypothetical protein HC828_08480, partial [Blastochloris sp.]|nr:hypothetical protein [Blastochloris sp.]